MLRDRLYIFGGLRISSPDAKPDSASYLLIIISDDQTTIVNSQINISATDFKTNCPRYGRIQFINRVSPSRKSTVDYFVPIHQPFTDRAVVRELLKRSEVAMEEVDQKWVLNTATRAPKTSV